MASMAPKKSRLPLHSEKTLSQPIHGHLLAYCSRTDLFAVVTLDEQVDIYRLGGQRAFSVKRKGPSINVVGLQWIRNGNCLAIALSSGIVDVVSGETGKIVRHGGDDPFSVDASGSRPEPGVITCLGWGTTLTGDIKPTSTTNKKTSQSQPTISNSGQVSTEEWYDNLHDNVATTLFNGDIAGDDTQNQHDIVNDLPRQLAFIDVESILPRLSPIPARANTGGRYDMFATQAALDDYFNSMSRRNRSSAEVMVVGHEEGPVRLIIDDILEVGLSSRDNKEGKNSLLYTSHPHSPCHALLRGIPDSAETGGPKSYHNLSLGLFDIPLLSSGGSHLHLIVSRTAQVRDLCNYISYSILCAKNDWTTNTNLPSRFMENINETLEEKQEGVLEQNLYHLAMTGNFSPTILEWLRDELAERGHKRWDHAMTTLYVELSKIFQTNLLPVLERCIVVATNLRGLARYYEGSKKFDVSPSVFTEIIDALCMLQLLVHEAIQILGEEQRQFRSFSKWLRHEIDLAAADPQSISAKDMAEREAPNLDYPRILAYLEGGLTKSKLKPIVHAHQPGEDGESSLPVNQKDVVRAIHQARQGVAERKDLLSLHTLSLHLNTVCKAAHSQILRWQNSTSPGIDEVTLECGTISSSAFDMKMVCVKPGVFNTIIATASKEEKNKLTIHTITKPPSSPSPLIATTSTTTSTTTARKSLVLTLPPTTEISAVRFLSDAHVLLLISTSSTSPFFITTTPSPPSSSSSSSATTTIDDESIGERRVHYLLRLPLAEEAREVQRVGAWAGCVIHSFSSEDGGGGDGFVPASLAVGEKEGAKVAVVVDERGSWWRIFDLEKRGAGALGEGVGEEDDEDDDDDDEDEEEEEDSMVLD